MKASSVVPRPLESLQGAPVPRFLSKTYDLVDDPKLDPIISWAPPTGKSFVVWDVVEFSRSVLPRNFKHDNFSSFVRQLNTYGFRKIDYNRWEFANEDFLRGRKPLLKNINRRRSCQVQQICRQVGSSVDTVKYDETEREVQKLRRERDLMMHEVVQVRQEHDITLEKISALNQHMQSAESRQKRMVSLLAKVLKSAAFSSSLQDRREIASKRVRRKFLKQQQSSMKCRLDSSVCRLPDPEHSEGSASSMAVYDRSGSTRLGDDPLEDSVKKIDFDIGGQRFFVNSAKSEGFEGSTGYFISSPDDRTVASDDNPLASEDVARPNSETDGLEGKNVMNFGTEYLTAFPYDISQEVMFEDGIALANDLAEDETFWNVGGVDSGDAREMGLASRSCSLWDLGLHTLEEDLDIDRICGW